MDRELLVYAKTQAKARALDRGRREEASPSSDRAPRRWDHAPEGCQIVFSSMNRSIQRGLVHAS